MDVRMIEKLKDKLCEELETVSRKPTMNAGDLEMMHKLTDTIKNLDKIEMLEGESNYGGSRGSRRNGGSYGSDSYGEGSYTDGGYSGRGRHYVRGHYSYAEGKEELKKQMESMMEDHSLSNEDRNKISRAMAELR